MKMILCREFQCLPGPSATSICPFRSRRRGPHAPRGLRASRDHRKGFWNRSAFRPKRVESWMHLEFAWQSEMRNACFPFYYIRLGNLSGRRKTESSNGTCGPSEAKRSSRGEHAADGKWPVFAQARYSSLRWAHQDSNLGPTDYESA